MKDKFIKIRYKIIGAYVLSAIFSGVSMILLFAICIIALNNKLAYFLHWLDTHLIAIPAILLLIIVLFFLVMSIFFLKLTQKSTNYLEEITLALQTISNGNLDTSIPVKTNDELGELAKIINAMTIKLNSLLEEERGWEKNKNELITNISHDLRTPLTSIVGYVELISKQKNLNEMKLQQYTRSIREKCTQLDSLIDDLFEYSKLTSEELTLDKKTLNLAELLEQVVMGFIPTLEEHHMEYRMNLGKIKILIYADPILLVRLFDNLINNAIKYGQDGKYIDVELLEVENEVIVKVSNYGESIPEEDLSHIFERLYRVEKSRSREKGGAGLGLAIVKSIVELHNGKVTAKSNDGITTFEVRLKTMSLC